MKTLVALVAFLAAVGPAAAFDRDGERGRRGETIELYKNDVIPVKFLHDIRISKSERGDRISAAVDGDRTLPKGTLFEGRVVAVRPGRDRRPGTIELEFNRIVLPNGDTVRVAATPVAWNEKGMTRTRNGRWEAKGSMRREDWVLGGLAGGLLVGSLARRPFEGAFIGTLAGILLAEGNASQSNDLVVRKGDRAGALIERDVRLDLDASEAEPERVRVIYEGRAIRYDRDCAPYEADGTVMVPLEATARALDLSVDMRDDWDFILINGRDGSVRLNRFGSDCRINGKRRELPRNPETKNGVLYVPLEVFEELANGTLRADGTKFE